MWFRHHRLVAAACAAVCVLAVISAVKAEPPGVRVTVTADALPSGHVITPADLTTSTMVAGTPPSDLSSDEAVGRTVSSPMTAGEIVTARRAIDPRDLPDGRVVAMMTVDPAVARIVRVGDTVDVIALADGESEPVTIVSAAEVLIVVADEVPVLGIAAGVDDARKVAAASLNTRLTVVMR